jgi:pyruvate,water dikinase
LDKNEAVAIAQYIPQQTKLTKKSSLGYLLGGLMTDGHIHLSKTHGEVQFIQKPTEEKQEFITKMNNCLKENYSKAFSETRKTESSGIIRGKKVAGNANAYRCYSKEIAEKIN